MKKYDFKKDNFTIIKKAIDPKLAEFLFNYFLIKKEVYKTMKDFNYITPFDRDWGVINDGQVKGAYAHYSDVAFETLLLKLLPVMEKTTKTKLYPTYSYSRLYEKGHELPKHKDRFECEISTTLNLGGDPWPIFIESDTSKGGYGPIHYEPSDSKGIKIILKPGDMLIYKGNICEHWREPFNGQECVQVFLHYNNQNTQNSEETIYDRRRHVGLPAWFKGKK